MTSSLTIVLAGLSIVAAAGAGAGVASGLARRPTFVRRAHLARDDWAIDPVAALMRSGAASFEVAVWLDSDGRLQVGARRWDRDAGNALGPRVLSRLAERAAACGGRMFERQRGSVTLMIEIVETRKSRREQAYQALDLVLHQHADVLSCCRNGVITPGAVTVVVTGDDAPRHVVAAQPERYVFIDGTLEDVGLCGPPANLVPIVSADWGRRFDWDGVESISSDERQRLRDIVTAAHEEGRRVRIYGLPQRPARIRERLWAELLDAGVDLITVTSDARALGRYLRRNGSRRHGPLRETITIPHQVRDDRLHEPPTAPRPRVTRSLRQVRQWITSARENERKKTPGRMVYYSATE